MTLVGQEPAVSINNFAQAVDKNFLLVDKTLMIQEFLGCTDEVALITRPRRFGKTLNLSMLEHFLAPEVMGRQTAGLFDKFDIAKVDNGEFLNKHQGQYPVIFISFKDVKAPSFEGAMVRIRELIEALFDQHKLALSKNEQFNTLLQEDAVFFKKFNRYLEGNVSIEQMVSSLVYLTQVLQRVYGKQVILLIDEYDSPLTAAYEHNYIDEMTAFMASLFSPALKGNPYLEKALMTGILRVSKNSMLSGLNNLVVYTILDSEYDQYFGFTNDEVIELCEHMKASDSLDNIRTYYNGYQINDTQLYNPWSVINYLKSGKLKPYWVLTSNSKILQSVLLNNKNEAKAKLEKLMQGYTIESDIHVNLRYEDLLERSTSLWTLLLFCGYLTIESCHRPTFNRLQCQLKIPNEEVLGQYQQVFVEWLQEKVGDDTYDAFLKTLVQGEVGIFTKQLSEYLLTCSSSQDFKAESDYHSFMLGLLAGITQTHYLYSNKDFGLGRPDCIIIPKDPKNDLGIVLEFKYVPSTAIKTPNDIEDIKQLTQTYAKDGLNQIDLRNYGSAFTQHTYIKRFLKVGIGFTKRIVSTASAIQMTDDTAPLTPENAFTSIFSELGALTTEKT